MRYSPWYNIWFLISLASPFIWHALTHWPCHKILKKMVEREKKKTIAFIWSLSYIDVFASGQTAGPNWQTQLLTVCVCACVATVHITKNELRQCRSNRDTKSKWCSALKIHRHTPNPFYSTWFFFLFRISCSQPRVEMVLSNGSDSVLVPRKMAYNYSIFDN